jgi:hypothetical protein
MDNLGSDSLREAALTQSVKSRAMPVNYDSYEEYEHVPNYYKENEDLDLKMITPNVISEAKRLLRSKYSDQVILRVRGCKYEVLFSKGTYLPYCKNCQNSMVVSKYETNSQICDKCQLIFYIYPEKIDPTQTLLIETKNNPTMPPGSSDGIYNNLAFVYKPFPRTIVQETTNFDIIMAKINNNDNN